MTPNRFLKPDFIRFVLGGGVTVVVEYVVFYVTYVFLGWNLLLANSLSFGVGLLVSFLFNRLWAFKQDSFHKKAHHQLALYGVLAAVNFFLNNAIVAGLQSVGVTPKLGKLVAIGLIAVCNYVIYKKIIFIKDRQLAK